MNAGQAIPTMVEDSSTLVEKMSLNIKNEETHRLARELAALTGESMSTAVQVALRERLDRVAHNDVEERKRKILAIAADAAGRWKEPFKSIDHGDLLYDELGLPK